jgi:hypothetical protein
MDRPPPRLVSADADFRQYAWEILEDGDGRPVVMRRCEELVEGRWEPFMSYASLSVAREVLAAAGYDLSIL